MIKIDIQKLPESKFLGTIIVDAEDFMSTRKEAVNKVLAVVDIDGFRKGHVPESVVIGKYGKNVFLEEMAELAMRMAYKQMLLDEKIVPVSDPEVTITKLELDSTFELTIGVTGMPDVKLPALDELVKKSTKSVDSPEVSEENVDAVIMEIVKARNHKHDEHCEHGEEPEAETASVILNDAVAESFGPQFKTIDDLRSVVRTNLLSERDHKLQEKKRAAAIEAILEKTNIEVPSIMIKSEQSRMLDQFKYEITRFGSTWESYLEESKKTESEIVASWNDESIKRIKSQLVIGKIAVDNNLIPTDTDIETELIKLLNEVRDADEENARAYIRQALTTENVFKFLGL